MSGLDLSDAYDNQRYVPDALERLGERAQRSLAFRARLQQVGRARLDLPYGDHLRQRYDLFLPTQASPKGLLVYIHGGYWHLRDKSDWSELASGALELGYACAIPSYRLAPTVSLVQLMDDVSLAIAAASKEIPNGALVLTGHSAGGHLCARLLCQDQSHSWQARVQAAASISGLHDLRPILQCSMNEILGLDFKTAQQLSPCFFQPYSDMRFMALVGANERSALIQQTAIKRISE